MPYFFEHNREELKWLGEYKEKILGEPEIRVQFNVVQIRMTLCCQASSCQPQSALSLQWPVLQRGKSHCLAFASPLEVPGGPSPQGTGPAPARSARQLQKPDLPAHTQRPPSHQASQTARSGRAEPFVLGGRNRSPHQRPAVPHPAMLSSRRVALVTGANKGIGFAIARDLCRQFSGDVVLTARDTARGQAAMQQLQAEGLSPRCHQLDINDLQSIRALRDFLKKEYGGLDVLVNNAGISFNSKEPGARRGGVLPGWPDPWEHPCGGAPLPLESRMAAWGRRRGGDRGAATAECTWNWTAFQPEGPLYFFVWDAWGSFPGCHAVFL
nr:uncharacterized protein LOC100061622 [Equus caballus]